MMRNRWLILAGVIAVVALAMWSGRRGRTGGSVDLLPLLPQAEKRSSPIPPEQAIRVVNATLNGESKSSILEQGFGRIEFKLTVPSDAWFSASLGIDPAAWDKEGDGVLFRMAVVSGSQYDELLNQHVNPAVNASERRWIPVAVDLSPYAGREVKIQLSTNPSLPGKPADLRNDLALWGAPTLTSGR